MHVFKNHISAVFIQKLTTTRRFLVISMRIVPNVVCCGNLSVIFRLTASWWQFSFHTFFRASNILNWAILTHERCRLIWFFIKFQKSLLLTFSKGNKVYDFWTRIPIQNLELWATLKRQASTPWKPKFCQETHLWRSFPKNFTSMDSEKGNRIFARGAGGGGGEAPASNHAPHRHRIYDRREESLGKPSFCLEKQGPPLRSFAVYKNFAFRSWSTWTCCLASILKFICTIVAVSSLVGTFVMF